MFIIGENYYIGFNTAKKLGNEEAAFGHVRCEAFGVDWVVFRRASGAVMAGTFDSLEAFIKELER